MVVLLSNAIVKMSHQFPPCRKVISKEQNKITLEIEIIILKRDLKIKLEYHKKENLRMKQVIHHA